MRAVDHLLAVLEIDGKRIIVTGHSRMGKAALFAAAFDERIAWPLWKDSAVSLIVTQNNEGVQSRS